MNLIKNAILGTLLLITGSISAQGFSVSGYVNDVTSGESIAKAKISMGELAVTSSAYGFYSLKLNTNSGALLVNATGYEPAIINLNLVKDTVLNINLSPSATSMGAVEITVKKKDNVRTLDIGNQQVSGSTIKKIPAFLGEADVIKAIQLLPGVSTVGEGASGFNVRGGAIDQNLILLDEAPVYNSSHLFGFFSVFNPDAVKEVELIKGGIPAMYGGRLSSTLDIRSKEGNLKRYGVEGGVGTIFSRLLVEGPIKKDKASFVISGRRSYIDILAKPFLNETLSGSQFYFYDFSGKINYKLNAKNRFYISTYWGDDVFSSETAFGVKYGNKTLTARWNHLFNKSLFSNFTYYNSRFRYNIVFKNRDNEFNWQSYIVNHGAKLDFNWFANKKHKVDFGSQSTFFNYIPGTAVAKNGSSITNFSLPDKYSLESSVYISDDFNTTGKLAIRYGLRATYYTYLGKSKVYEYDPNTAPGQRRQPIKTYTVESGKTIVDYFNLEPRASLRYQVNKNSSVKLGYNRMVQNIHLISNTSASVPFDVYQPSTNNIKPEIADQLSIGYFENLTIAKQQFEASIETYYKDLQNQVDYIDGASLLLNENLEGELLPGIGRAYGAEFYFKKNSGKLTGWISYTLSRSERKTKGINDFEWYAARFDKLHNANLTVQYTLNKKFEFGSNIIFSTGTPTTFYSSQYQIQGYTVPDPGGNVRNNVRNPNYFRVDLSATYKRKNTEKYESSWVFSVYNALNRRNPFSVYFATDYKGSGQNEAIRYSIIGSIIPAISYNFKWK